MHANDVKAIIANSIKVKNDILQNELALARILSASETIIKALKSGKKLLICGNGGSAADSQHFAAELVCRFKTERRALPAIALTADTSAITAWSNDYEYNSYFSRAVEALAQEGDVFLGISTSGNSKNVCLAAQSAKARGCATIAMTGLGGGELGKCVDVTVEVPSTETARIQESHILIIHVLCANIDNAFG